MYPTDKICKYMYERRGAISAVYIVIIPGIINIEEIKRYPLCLDPTDSWFWGQSF